MIEHLSFAQVMARRVHPDVLGSVIVITVDMLAKYGIVSLLEARRLIAAMGVREANSPSTTTASIRFRDDA